MIIQNLIFPDAVCDMEDMYFRTDGCCNRKANNIELQSGESMTTDTYMNVLDIGHWKKYTQLGMVTLSIRAKGHFIIRFSASQGKIETILSEQEYDTAGREKEIFVSLPESLRGGLVFFRMKAVEKAVFYGGYYMTGVHPVHDIRMAADICTFHRKQQMERNLQKFSSSAFFDQTSELYGRLKVYVTDNGDDFVSSYPDEWVVLIRNSNRGGGTGGFTRGLEEIRSRYYEFPCSHIVFMDDDVEFQIESFYRLYAFLSLIRSEYADRSLSGRMFRLDQRNIQYTAAEKWNKGNIIHIGAGKDMCRKENLTEEKDQTGEYGGWWLCVFPAGVSLKNKPFPFFLHCDDVEYGLRQKKDVLTLRGFQVWHQTYEYHMSPKILYYDIRNTLVVNAMQGEFENAEQAVAMWKQRMTEFHNEGKQTEKYLCALAMWDFGRRHIFKRRRGQIPEICIWIGGQVRLLKMLTPVFYRIAETYVRQNFEKIVESYRKSREETIWQ